MNNNEAPICHMKPMTYEVSDCDDVGNFEHWFECEYCGHTKDVTLNKSTVDLIAKTLSLL